MTRMPPSTHPATPVPRPTPIRASRCGPVRLRGKTESTGNGGWDGQVGLRHVSGTQPPSGFSLGARAFARSPRHRPRPWPGGRRGSRGRPAPRAVSSPLPLFLSTVRSRGNSAMSPPGPVASSCSGACPFLLDDTTIRICIFIRCNHSALHCASAIRRSSRNSVLLAAIDTLCRFSDCRGPIRPAMAALGRPSLRAHLDGPICPVHEVTLRRP
jgi:hypothetical protein